MSSLKAQPGIINSDFYPSSLPLPPPEEPTQESTLQLPFGEFSILSELKNGYVKPIVAMTTLTLCYRSNWSTGITWKTSTRTLASLLGISHRYVRDTLSQATDWITRKTQPKGNVAGNFYITHHNCQANETPTDKQGIPLSYAVPRGESGIFEMLFSGQITWKAALTWLLLKLHSCWTTGVTNAISMATLAKWTGFGKATIIKIIKQLKSAGLLKRLSKRHEASVFQLLPKPYKTRKDRRLPKPKRKKYYDKQMKAEGIYCYSINELYRLNRETGDIEHRERKNRGEWKRISDHHKAVKMPKAIREDFERILVVMRSINGSSDTAQCGSDTAHIGLDTARGSFARLSKSSLQLDS